MFNVVIIYLLKIIYLLYILLYLLLYLLLYFFLLYIIIFIIYIILYILSYIFCATFIFDWLLIVNKKNLVQYKYKFNGKISINHLLVFTFDEQFEYMFNFSVLWIIIIYKIIDINSLYIHIHFYLYIGYCNDYFFIQIIINDIMIIFLC